MISVLIFLVIILALVILAPPLLGFLFWLWNKLRRRSESFEDSMLRGYGVAYGDQKKI